MKKNKITAINGWPVAAFRYGAQMLQWKESELEDVERKSRKAIAMYRALHQRSVADRLCIKTKQ